MNHGNGEVKDWDHLDALLGEMREKKAERNRKVSKRDAEITELAARHNGKINELQAEFDEMERRAVVFLEANRTVFGEPNGKIPRSRDLLHGRVGARLGTPKLGMLRGLSAGEVVAYIQASSKRALSKFLRFSVDLDRQKILSEMDEQTMQEVGLCRVQDDRVFVDLKEA